MVKLDHKNILWRFFRRKIFFSFNHHIYSPDILFALAHTTFDDSNPQYLFVYLIFNNFIN